MLVCVLKSKCSVVSHLKCVEYTESSSRAHRNSLKASPKDCYPQVFRQDPCAGLSFSKVVLCPQKFLSSSIKGLHCDIRPVTSSSDQSCIWDDPLPTSSSLLSSLSNQLLVDVVSYWPLWPVLLFLSHPCVQGLLKSLAIPLPPQDLMVCWALPSMHWKC